MYITEDDLLPFVTKGELRHLNPGALGRPEHRQTYATGEALAFLKQAGFQTFPSQAVPAGAELVKDGEFTRIMDGPNATRLHGLINNEQQKQPSEVAR